MNQKIIDMDTTTLIFLIIGIAAVALTKILQELLKFLFIILVAVFAIWFSVASIQNAKKSTTPVQPSAPQDVPEIVSEDTLQKDTLLQRVGNQFLNESVGVPPSTSEMKKTQPFTFDKSELSPVVATRPSLPDSRYNLDDRINKVTKFPTPSYILAGAYAQNLEQAKRMAKYLNSIGFDHLFIVYLPDYDVEGAEGWPYAITITGAYGKLKNLGAESNYFYHLAQLNKQTSPALDVLYLRGYLK